MQELLVIVTRHEFEEILIQERKNLFPERFAAGGASNEAVVVVVVVAVVAPAVILVQRGRGVDGRGSDAEVVKRRARGHRPGRRKNRAQNPGQFRRRRHDTSLKMLTLFNINVINTKKLLVEISCFLSLSPLMLVDRMLGLALSLSLAAQFKDF